MWDVELLGNVALLAAGGTLLIAVALCVLFRLENSLRLDERPNVREPTRRRMNDLAIVALPRPRPGPSSAGKGLDRHGG